MKNEIVSYQSEKKGRTRLEFAREVNKALQANEDQGDFEHSPSEKRSILRHELLHHIPLEHQKVIVSGLLRKDKNGDYTHSKITTDHPNAGGREEIVSALNVISDGRFKQKPSPTDIKMAMSGLLGILVGK